MASEEGAMHPKHAGAHNELLATVWLLKQGYEVFRNVSQHGIIDIVAVKDGEITLFDVKKSWTAHGGKAMHTALSAEQCRAGVKLLAVFSNGNCEIVLSPHTKFAENIPCEQCGKIFMSIRRQGRFCSNFCRGDFARMKNSADYRKKKTASIGPRAGNWEQGI